MTAGKPPTVVFDIGNVLLRWNPRNLFRKLFDGDDAAMEAFLASALSMDWILELDRSDIASQMPARIAAFPHYRAQLEAFDTRWLETLDGTIEANVALFERLKAGGDKVYGLTNFSHDKFDLARGHFPFFDWFEDVVVSGREGIVKPDPRIYALLFDRHGLRPADTLFVDDSPRNVAAARALGMDAVHYTPNCDLAAEFAKRGILA